MISFIISLVITGLIIGALGRLAIPGRNPMSIGMTILIGIAGSFVGGMIGYAIAGQNRGVGLLLSVLVAAGIIWFMQRREATA